MVGGTAQAYVAGALDDAPRPGVLMFMDAFGVRARTMEMADRIAGWGLRVLLPNVFWRGGTIEDLAPDAPLTDDAARSAYFTRIMPRIRALTPPLFIEQDLPRYLDALDGLPGVVPGAPIGVVGYCMGARLSTYAATAAPDRVIACGGFHGGGLAGEEPHSPHLGLGSARARFVYGHADADASMPPEAVERLGAALAAAGLVATNEIYPGARHGYTMADTASYDEASAERHFSELEQLFVQTLL